MPSRRREPSRIPIRGALALALTVGGMALLLSFRTPQSTEVALALADVEVVPATPLTSAVPATPAVTATAVTTPGPSPSPSAAVSAGPEPSPSVAVQASPGLVTVTGDPIRIRWGTVQVAVTFSGSDIVEVEALALPDSDRHSLQISQYVEPILREEAVAADSADIDAISGATYTSRAYAASLQSALDQLAA
jgi:uncharacterized protein with FMN-binding domain